MKNSRIIEIIILSVFVWIVYSSCQQSNATFTCSSNADCKAKCEALGSDHVWKPNPGGSTFGTCTKRGKGVTPEKPVAKLPDKVILDSLSMISDNGQVILDEINELFSKSDVLRRFNLHNTSINSISLIFDNSGLNNTRICASCLGAGFAVELCCPPSNPNCQDPCRDGVPY